MVAGSAFSLVVSLLMYWMFLVMSCVCALRSSATIATGAQDSSGRNEAWKENTLRYMYIYER